MLGMRRYPDPAEFRLLVDPEDVHSRSQVFRAECSLCEQVVYCTVDTYTERTKAHYKTKHVHPSSWWVRLLRKLLGH